MNTSKQALALSLTFHSLMALTALWMLTSIHSQTTSFTVPLKHITIVSLSQLSKIVSPPTELAQPLNQTPTPEIPKQKIAKPIPNEALHPLTAAPRVPSIAVPVAEAAVPTVINTKPNVSTATVQTPAQSPLKATRKVDISAEKQSFLAYLRTTIQQNLHYPSAARRRGIEGEVNVRFTLENGGIIRNIAIFEGEKIFHEEAKRAIVSASGIKIPEVLSGTFPTDMQLTLAFKLD